MNMELEGVCYSEMFVTLEIAYVKKKKKKLKRRVTFFVTLARATIALVFTIASSVVLRFYCVLNLLIVACFFVFCFIHHLFKTQQHLICFETLTNSSLF